MDIILHTPAPLTEDDRATDDSGSNAHRASDGAIVERGTEARSSPRDPERRMADERAAHWCDVDEHPNTAHVSGAGETDDPAATLDQEVRRWRFVLGRIGLWLTLWSERRTLATLDRRMLADIGVDEASALVEASRKAWDVPHGRKPQVRHDIYR